MTISINKPERFTTKQVIAENLISLIPQIVFGALIGFGIFGLIGDLYLLATIDKSAFGVLIPICALILGLIFLLFAPYTLMMNFFIKYIVKKAGLSCTNSNEYITQISLQPRLYKGVRGVLEDADDVGVLRVEDDRIVFTGDSVNINILYSTIESVMKHNAGWRGFWISGKRIRIHLLEANKYSRIDFFERQSVTILEANKISKIVLTLISEKIKIRANQRL